MTRSKYFGPIKWLGSSAVLVLLFGLLWDALRDDIFTGSTRNAVLVRAIPFIAVFITIILCFALLIFMVALRFNGKVPIRTHKPIEWTAIVGILFGVFCLFQPWSRIPYEYGFLLLLGSLLLFILWSHVESDNGKLNETFKPFSLQQHLAGAILALIFVVVFTVVIANIVEPQPPYGYRQREWDRRFNDEQKAQIAEEAKDDYRTIEIPLLVILSLFPGALIYFITREVSGSLLGASVGAANVTQTASST